MNKVKQFFGCNKYKILFLMILMLAIFVRAYKINLIPIGIHVDEAGMAYDAFCLANNGTDRFLHHLPVYLENFGGGQSALYAYLAAIFVKILGLRMIAIRMPALILSVIGLLCAYFIIRKEFGKKFSLVFMFLIATCPFLILSSRFGLDCNLFSPMIIISTLVLLKSEKPWQYVLSGILFGITLYTYAVSYIILPIFLFLTLIYMLYTKKIKFKQLFFIGIPLFILALPLMLMILVNNGIINEIEGFVSIIKLPDYRYSEISLSLIKDNLKFILVAFNNDGIPYNALKEFGSVYGITKYLIVIGFFISLYNLLKSLKDRKFSCEIVLLFIFIAVFVCMLIIVGPNINKANALYIPAMFLATLALKTFYKWYKAIFWIIITAILVCFMNFEYYYFTDYINDYKYQSLFEYDYLMAIKYVNETEEINNKNVHVIGEIIEPYIHTLYVNKTLPEEFNKTIHEDTFDNDLYSYGKYFFKDETYDENAVYIIKDQDPIVNVLIQNGFSEDIQPNFGIYHVWYKK